MNPGKQFEADIKASCPAGCWMYRLRDNPATYGAMDNSALRFASDNVCDFIAYRHPALYLIECKTVAGLIAPLSAMFGKAGADGRHKKQKHLDDMQTASDYTGVVSLVLINYRQAGTTYALTAGQCLEWIYRATDGGRKSIPEAWCRTNARRVDGRKLRVNWRWNLAALMDEMEDDNGNP